MIVNCSVPLCAGSSSRFSFPRPDKDPERLLQWLRAAGNSNLLQVVPSKISNRRLCIKHFEIQYRFPKKLTGDAVPTLNLPEPIDSSSYFEDHQYTMVFKPTSYTPMCASNEQEPESTSMPEFVEGCVSPRSITPNSIGTADLPNSPLALLKVTHKNFLTPRDKKIYNSVVHLRKAARLAQRHNMTIGARLLLADSLVDQGSWNAIQGLPETTKTFFQSYFRDVKRRKFHRLYSLKDKVFALALYKRSAVAYRFMRDIFCLPSEKTLRKVVLQIPLMPGHCDILYEALGKKVNRMSSPKSHYCILAFEETAVNPSLHYNVTTTSIEGFEDDGDTRTKTIAGRAMVYMLKGVEGEWTQPIVFTFVGGSSPQEAIQKNFKEIVRRCRAVGLRVIASVCNQGATNCEAVKEMVADSKRNALRTGQILQDDVIIVDNQTIIPLYDVPHLIKCIRDNLLTKDCTFQLTDERTLTAKWTDIFNTYKIDQESTIPGLSEITDYHVDAKLIPKMKVKYASQIFSHSFASRVSTFSRFSVKSRDGSVALDSSADDTAQFLKTFHDLFQYCQSKISTTSSNHQFDLFKKILGTLKFVKRNSNDREHPIFLKNWQSTIDGFKCLKKCMDDLRFKFFTGKVFNQDTVENFFKQIKQHRHRNSKPNCASFSNHYKNLFMQNFTSHSSKFNCPDDVATNAIMDLEEIISAPTNIKSHLTPTQLFSEVALQQPVTFTLPLDSIVRKTRKKTRSIHLKCMICRENITRDSYLNSLSKIIESLPFYIDNYCHFSNFGNIMHDYYKTQQTFDFLDCEHKLNLIDTTISTTISFSVQYFTKIINKILLGKIRDMNYRGDIALQAIHIFQKQQPKKLRKIL